jgi:hypothetical protein
LSWRRSLSFAEDELELVNHFDNNGKSDFAKEAMKFFLRFKDKLYIIPDGLSISGISKVNRPVKDETKNKMIKLIQK